MQIRYIRKESAMLIFPAGEIKVALAVLRAVDKVNPAGFIKDAIKDMEEDLAPKKLPMVNYFHICEKCKCEMDERGDNALHIVKDDSDQWVHHVCPPLKQNRPV